MTITYRLTKAEVLRSFFASIAGSQKFLAMILIYSTGLAAAVYFSGGRVLRSMGEAMIFLAYIAGAFLFIAFWLFIRGKTDERTLSISAEGISTQIGTLSANLPWSKIGIVQNVGGHVLIVGRSGNAFFVPSRAFRDTDQQAQFCASLEKLRGG